jgi:hypothetical protein
MQKRNERLGYCRDLMVIASLDCRSVSGSAVAATSSRYADGSDGDADHRRSASGGRQQQREGKSCTAALLFMPMATIHRALMGMPILRA